MHANGDIPATVLSSKRNLLMTTQKHNEAEIRNFQPVKFISNMETLHRNLQKWKHTEQLITP